MKLMICTFSEGDAPKVFGAMRMLSYDRLVLVGEAGADATEDFSAIERLESLSGDEVLFETVDTPDFLEMVDRLCEVLGKYKGHELMLNVSGGSKLLGDAALFAAFRAGVPAYHVEDKVVRLPVLHGASAEAVLTPLQMDVITKVRDDSTIDDLLETTGARNRSALERVARELKKKGLITMGLKSGAVSINLTQQGIDLLKWIPEHARQGQCNRASHGLRASEGSGSVV